MRAVNLLPRDHGQRTIKKESLPVLVGASRKGFLGAITGKGPKDRLAASLACAARAFEAGASAVRVHDVRETVDLLDTLARLAPSA